MTEDVLTGTFDFLAEVVAVRTFSTDEVVTGTFFVREVVTGTFIFSVAEIIFLLVEVSGTSAFFFFVYTTTGSRIEGSLFTIHFVKISKGAKKIWVQRVAKTYGFKGLRKIMVSKGYKKLWFQGVAKKIWLIRVVKKILQMVAKKKN